MATANEEFLDALLRHQVFLQRLSGGIRNDVIEILNATEQEIAELIRTRLFNVKGGPTAANLRRAELLMRSIAKIRNPAWAKVTETWFTEMFELAQAEPAFTAGLIRTIVPVELDLLLPSRATLRSIVTSRPFEGMVLKGWANNIRRADLTRIQSQIGIGIVQGESSSTIAQRVVGTARQRGRDGVTQIARNQAASITRTAVNHVSNQARRDLFVANDDILTRELYVATLDGVTTPICRSLDGKKFKVGEGPIPPLHFSCRSLRVAALDGNALGKRPFKAATERGLVRDFTKKEGIKGVTSRKGLPFGSKGDFDKFARGRIRVLTGTVPARTTYQQFLTRQSAAFQDDVMGVTKGRLFRRGGLTVDKFVDRTGGELTLSQLAGRHANAFRAAGLDPQDFL